jgi:hypothetical protein
MPRGIESIPIAGKPGCEANPKGVDPAPATDKVFGPGPLGRGVTVTTSEPGGTLPR